jgi:L-seryl-tRNA(Ser) seleniumtransferase
MSDDARSGLPAIGRLIGRDDVRALMASHGRAAVLEALRRIVAEARASGAPLDEASAIASASAALATTTSTLRPVINATGVVLHTNLGRAELSSGARAAAASIGAGPVSLELASGARGDRHRHAAERLITITGAEAACVVNNAAAALVLALASYAREGRAAAVIVSRGELVEIGGAFRIPEIVEAGGARLVEVGTTNRTRIDDYARALDRAGEGPTVLLKVHRSNFAMLGFTEETSVAALAALASRHPLAPEVVFDQGSGLLLDGERLGLDDEPSAPRAIADGASLVVFSGDKLLGGPQAGIAVGTARRIEAMRRHPLMRALRAGKLVLAALDATLASYARGDALEALPSLAKIVAAPEAVRARAERLCRGIAGSSVVPSVARVGAGAQPTRELASFAVAIADPHPNELAARLRSARPAAIVTRVQDGALLLDARTLDDEDVEAVIAEVDAARRVALERGSP